MCFPRLARASLVGAFALFLVHSFGALHAQTSFPGCTDPDACNYNVAATVDDGTCIYAIVDDDCEAGGIACSEGMYWNPVLQKCLLIACENCVGDLTGDGFINTADLLEFLAVFGNFCPEGGCTDVYALNYNPDAGYNDGSCVFSPCDLVQLGDPCDDGDANTYNDVIQGEECGCLGTPYVDPTGNGACAGQSFASYQGYDYRLVEIGDQCWFQENCRFLPDVVPADVCSDSTAFAYVLNYDGYDASEAMLTPEYDQYGALYNQRAAIDWDLCPSGFRMASDMDWLILESQIGISQADLLSLGWRGTNQGKQLKSNLFWNGTDDFGFAVLPGGYRQQSGSGIFGAGDHGYFWTSTELDSLEGSFRGFISDSVKVRRDVTSRLWGFSARCVADAALGCTDPGACNFDPAAEINDGSCIVLQEEGTWCDDEDATTFNDVILADGCTCEGTPYVALDGSGPCEATNVVTYQGFDYRLVEIGDQCWFADNLRSQHYLNGDSILHASDAATWAEYADLDTGGICASDYDESLAEVYGYQYNFYAVEDERGLCPSGYHVPSDQEWKDLESFMGMPATLLNDWGARGYEERYGEELRARNTDFWPYSWLDSMNIRGFEALPNGIATASFGQQYEVNEVAHFWSSTRYITSFVSRRDNSISRSIPSGESIYGNGINRYYNLWQTAGGRGHGMAVRCLKDEGCVSEGPVFDNPYFTDGEVQQISLSCEDGLQVDIAPYELTATDECDGEVLVTMSIDSYPLEVCGTGNLVTYTATNSQGQTATTSYTFEVFDGTGPVINAFAESINISEIGFEWCEASEDLPPVDNQGLFIDVFDACGVVATVEQSYVDGPVDLYLCPGGYGFTRVHTILASDDCGNWSTATVEQQVYVFDITPPAIADVTLTVDCAAYDPSSLTALVANELNLSACESVSLTSNGSSTICGSAGVNRFFTAVATDACGNTSTAEVVVQVQDTTAPYLYVYNQDIVVECSASDSDIFNSVYFETADNCSDVSVSMEVVPVYDECGLLNGGSYVLVTATDACGNQSSAQVNVQQIDSNPPTISIPDVTFECDGAGNVDEINAWIESHGGAFVDDCCDVVWSHSVLSNTADSGCGGNVVVNFTATDVFGNSSTSTAVAFIVDNTPPTLTLSQESEMYVFSDPDPFGWCGTPDVEFVFPVGEPLAGVFVYASDNCSDVTYSHSYVDSNPQSTGCGADYTFIRTHILVAEDACGNLTTESIDQVVQVDYEVPDFSGWDVTLSCSDSPDYSVFVNEIQNALPSCSNYTVSFQLLDSYYPGCSEAQYEFQVTIDDGCGGVVAVPGVVHLIDETAPVFTYVPSDYTVSCSSDIWSDFAYATDNCSGVTIYMQEEILPFEGCPQQFQVLRTFTAADDCNNTVSYTQTITVVDSIPPDITGSGELTNGEIIHVCGEVPPPLEITAIDDCEGVVQVDFEESYTIADDFENGISYESYERTYTATDCAGNATVFTYTVNILPDTDGDGLCNVDDPDDDNDGVPDDQDWSPFNPAECSDVDGDGCDDCNPLDDSIDLFDEYNDGAWAVEQPIISFVEGSMLATGNNAMMRSQTMLTSLLQVEAQLVKDEDCDDHYLILSTDPNFTWDWGATTSGVIIGWNCSSAHLNGTSVGSCQDMGAYNVSIDVGWSQFMVTTDCGTYTVPNPTGNLDFYIYVGADNDGGDAEWLDIRWTQLGEATFDPSTDGLDSDGDGLCDAGDSAPLPGDCGNPVSYQGYDYATVQIGEQCWFAENLRSENYENGDAIPAGLSDSEWSSTTSGAVAVYGEESSTCYNESPDGDACDEAWSLNEYGRLYNWYAVDDSRGLCPSGWHVPTDGEWMTMEISLGMSEAEANVLGYRGTDEGTKMKTDYGWSSNGNGTNLSGFTGLPGGSRQKGNGMFDSAGSSGYWWSSSPIGSTAWYRSLAANDQLVARFSSDLPTGLSVRCVRDVQ